MNDTVHATIERRLADAFDTTHLGVVNESSNHNVPPGSETHFRVLVVSPSFHGQNRVARHRAVHTALAEQLRGGVHALAIDAWTPEEWRERGAPSVSPDCRGGAGR